MRTVATALSLALLVIAPAAQEPAQGRAPTAWAEQARQILARQQAQTELPVAGGVGGEAPAVAARNRGARAAGEPRRSVPDSGLHLGWSGFAEPLLWLVVGVAGVVLLVAIVRGLVGRAAVPPTTTPRVMVDHGRAAGSQPEVLPDHVQLAAVGDFAAALQALLLHALALLQQRSGALPPHTTARAAVRLARGRSLPAEQLATVVSASERVQFAGMAAERSDYAAALQAYEQWRAGCAPKP